MTDNILDDILTNCEEVPIGETGDAESGLRPELDKRQLPHRPFPVDALHPVLREMVSEVSRFANVDASVPAIGVLTIAASVIGSTHRIIVDGAVQPSILWGVIVIPSGEGKSEALDPLMKPLDRIDKRWAKQNAEAMEVYSRAFANWDQRRKAATKGKSPAPFDEPSPMEPQQKRLVVNETTVEALFRTLEDNPDGIHVHKDELAEWFAMNVYTGAKGKDESFWNASFNGKSYSVDRKQAKSNRIENTTLSLLGGIQPRVLQRILKRGADLTDSGLTLRPIYTMPPVLDHRAGERAIDAGIRARYERLVDDMLKLREPPPPIPQEFIDILKRDDFESTPPQSAEPEREPVDIPLSTEARAVYDAFIVSNGAEHKRLADSPLKSYLARMRGTVKRIALDLHCVNQIAEASSVDGAGLLAMMRVAAADEVSAATMRDAVRIAEWAKYEFRRVFTSFGLQPDRADETDRDAEAILRVIDNHDGGVTVSDIQHGSRRFRNGGDAERVEQKLLELKRAGVVESETEMADGRAVTRYRRA